MNIQSWMIKSWATLEWYLPPEAEALPRFNLVGTQIRDDGSATGFRAGDTVWVADDEDGQAGLAWEWVEVQPGVVMLADPNSIITNLQIVDSANGPVSGLAKTIAVNRMVHALPWQSTVCSQLTETVASAPARMPAAEPQRHWPLQPPPAQRGAAAASFGAPVFAPAARRAPAAPPAAHPVQDWNRRQPMDAGSRPLTRASDKEPAFERRVSRDLRRAA